MGICVLIVTDTYRYIFLLIFIFIFSFVHAIGQCDKKDKNRKTFNDDMWEGVCEMREKVIEQKLAVAVKQAGGMALKFVSPGFDGMPDRIVLLPDEHIAFVEVKAPGKKPRPLQLARHRLLRKLGFQVYVIDSADQIGGMLDEIRAT